MRIRLFCICCLFFCSRLETANAQHAHEHPSFFHAFTFEGDLGEGEHDPVSTWDLDGWLGSDFNKLWLKSEGEVTDSDVETAETWALYSRNISEFWDAQAGVRYDFEPVSQTYLTFGFQGLAKYFFETEAHLFISNEGDISARLRQENDLLLTQQLIMQPYAEINIFAQDVDKQDIGAGFAASEFGIQTRYELSRKFAPYIDLRYERSFGETGRIAVQDGGHREDFIASLGMRIMF